MAEWLLGLLSAAGMSIYPESGKHLEILLYFFFNTSTLLLFYGIFIAVIFHSIQLIDGSYIMYTI